MVVESELSAISFHVVQIGPGQNLAATVWSAVRVVLVLCPSVLTPSSACKWHRGAGAAASR